MDRRRFLSALASGVFGGAMAHTLDLDKLLWVPGAKRIFLPAAANRFLTVEEITRESLRMLKNELAFSSLVNRHYDLDHPMDKTMSGYTVNVRVPQRYQVASV